MSKVCTSCRISKPVIFFSFESKEKGTYRSKCKECLKSIRNERGQKVNEEMKERKIDPSTIHKICNKCEKNKNLLQFSKCSGTKDGHRHICKECSSNSEQERYNTLRGRLTTLVYNAQKYADYHAKRGLVEENKFDITLEDVMDIWEKQKGICYYDNIPMQFEVNDENYEYQASIDKIDHKIGFIKNNIILCRIGSKKRKIGNIRMTNGDNDEKKEDKCVNCNNSYVKNGDSDKCKKCVIHIKRMNSENVEKECIKCNSKKMGSEFGLSETSVDGRENVCKPCKSAKAIENRKTSLPSKFHQLINSAKKAAKENKEKGREEQAKFDLTLESIEKKWDDQEGKCFRSNEMMTLEGDNCVSFQRKDEMAGYTNDNIVLVCVKEHSNAFKKRALPENTETMKTCIECKKTKLMECFPRNHSAICGRENTCEKCKNLKRKVRQSTNVSSKLKTLLNNARSTCKKEASKGNMNIVLGITLDDLMDMWNEQNAMCKKSGRPLELEGDYCVTLKRYNTKMSFSKDNLCLVTKESA